MSDFTLHTAGYFAKPHGIKGEIAAMIDVDGVDIEPGSFVFARIDGLDVPFRVLAVRPKGAGLLLTLKGIENENDAAAIANTPLSVDYPIALPDASGDEDADFFQLDDLIGFTVTCNGAELGRVDDYDDSTDNFLFIVERADGSTLLVPAVDDLIVNIDTGAQTIEMDLPVGLADLNS